MPNAVNARRDEQWDLCDRCGFQFPMSQLTKQKGMLLCIKKCVDDLTVERRPFMIGQILGAGVDQEGVDLRVVDRGFFSESGDDEGVV